LLDTDENAAARAGEWLATIIEAALPERDLVVVSSGPAPAGSQTEQSLERLARILQPLAQRAASRGVRLALRPAHGNFIATFAHFLRWQRWCDAGTAVACVADLDAMALQGELPLLTRFELLGKALGGVWAEYFAHPNLADPIVTRHALPWTAIAGSLHEAKFDGPVCLRLIGPPERAIAHALRIREAVEPAFRAEQSG
jgi:sugar phosphate isomerase/epimerase